MLADCHYIYMHTNDSITINAQIEVIGEGLFYVLQLPNFPNNQIYMCCLMAKLIYGIVFVCLQATININIVARMLI